MVPSDSLLAEEVGGYGRVRMGLLATGAAVSIGGGATAEDVLLVRLRAGEAVVPLPETVHIAVAEGVLAQNCGENMGVAF